MMSDLADFAPPPTPPPFLSWQDLESLMEHGHVPVNLPPSLAQLCDDLDRTMQGFFSDHDETTKQTAYPAAHGTERGYYVVDGEKEYVTLRCHSTPSSATAAAAPFGSKGNKHEHEHDQNYEHGHKQEVDIDAIRNSLETLSAAVWRETATLMYRILFQIGEVLDIEPHAWDPILSRCLTLPPSWEHATPSLLRLFRYEPEQGAAGPHLDNGLLTLCVGSGKGLQVWTRSTNADSADAPGNLADALNGPSAVQQSASTPASSVPTSESCRSSSTPVPNSGSWSDARGPTLLIGSSLSILASNRIAAGSHRVVPNPLGRRSIVFALRPSTGIQVDLAPFGGTGTWDMGDMLRWIQKGRVNVNARVDVRDGQRAELQSRRRERNRDKDRTCQAGTTNEGQEDTVKGHEGGFGLG